MIHELPKLKYSYSALEPYIDAQTMEIHYTKHHAAYINNLNKALEPQTKLVDYSVEDLITHLDMLPQDIQTVVRNNAGGHYNHTLFWDILGPATESNKPSGSLATQIEKTWENLEKFKEEFTKAAMGRFGSGWAWLALNKDGKLSITSTPNQDSPLMDSKLPLMGLDVWEHAYYLKYQNRRADYVSGWWSVINWKNVEYRYQEGLLKFPSNLLLKKEA